MEPTKSSNEEGRDEIRRKPVREIIEPATAVPKEASVKVALEACAADGVETSAVTEDEGKLVGTVSKNQMNRKVGGMGHDPESSPVEPQVDKQSPYCVEDQTVSEAEKLMREKNVAEVPVVNKDNVLIGKTNLGKIEDARFELYTDAALARDIPEHRLLRGDVVKIIDHHRSPNGENGYSIEVFNALGDTVAVTTVPESALESLRRDEVLSVRPLTREAIRT